MEFPLQPQVAALIHPRLNRRNPHELHWRRETPEWHGSLAATQGHLYGHLADHSCCLQCGAIPCPFDHDEHHRLRLADLEFIKDLAKERRELKEKVGRLIERLRQFERAETEWERQKKMMEGEIDRLKSLNADNLKKIQNYKKEQEKLRILTKRVENLERENAALLEENKKFRQLIVKQDGDIRKMEERCRDLEKQAEEGHVTIRRLRVQLDETHEELRNARNALAQREARIRELEIDLMALTQEMERKAEEYRRKDEQNLHKIKQLQNEILALSLKLENSERDNGDLQRRIEELLAEVERLKAKLSSDTRFRRFVDIKRECNELKEYNESLTAKVAEHEKIYFPLPVMKSSGRIKSSTGGKNSTHNNNNNVNSSCNNNSNGVAELSNKRPGSAVRVTILNRPKSARTLQALDDRDSDT